MRLLDRANPAARRAATAAPAREGVWLSAGLMVAFLAINLLVLLNAMIHDPAIGYDAKYHLRYIEVLAQLRLPTAADTKEFFSPPLPYLLPALFMAATKVDVAAAAKFAQLVQVLISIGITYYLVRLCELIWPGLARAKLAALLCLGMLPVYYKTLAFVRGEPYVAFFTLLAVYQLLQIEQESGGGRRPRIWRGVALGVAMGLLALSRQWGLLVLPALALVGLALVLRAPVRARARLLGVLALSGVLAVLLGGWFYLGLQREYGSITAFNREGRPFAFTNQPAHFYRGLGDGRLFSYPVRPAFPNQLLPIFYSETWGDYSAYFLVYARQTEFDLYILGSGFEDISLLESAPWLETNRQAMGAYLGRVNLVALLPTALLLGGCLLGLGRLARWAVASSPAAEQSAAALLALVLLASALGYGWFLLSYPSLDQGDTIKATYMLHLFPPTALLAAAALERLRRRAPALSRAALVLLALVWVHNLPAMVSRYWS